MIQRRRSGTSRPAVGKKDRIVISLRAWHSYLSIFVAPTILFFALTGSLQIFNLHESHGGYHAAVLIQKLARVHKDQVFALDQGHDEDAAPSAPAAHADDDEARTPAATLVLKWFFLSAALALVGSTCLGLWIGLTHVKRRRVAWVLLALGTVLPVLLVIA